MNVLKLILWEIMRWLIPFFASVYFAKFSILQSIIIAILFRFICYAISEADKNKYYLFVPYHVDIFPKWDLILTEYNIVENYSKGHEIKMKLLDEEGYDHKNHLFGHCFSYEVIHQEPDFKWKGSKRNLIFSRYGISSEVDFRCILPLHKLRDGRTFEEASSQFDLKNLNAQDLVSTVTLFVKGSSIGIIVKTQWWNIIKDQCPTPIKVESDGWRTKADDILSELRITLAEIPYFEFEEYENPCVGDFCNNPNLAHKTHKLIIDSRQKCGWEYRESDVKQTIIEHQYFSLWHNKI